nr:hypothetical protein Iba_chr12bCG26820 [Ipomoea batatas]
MGCMEFVWTIDVCRNGGLYCCRVFVNLRENARKRLCAWRCKAGKFPTWSAINTTREEVIPC